jgi:hypothetical protein
LKEVVGFQLLVISQRRADNGQLDAVGCGFSVVDPVKIALAKFWLRNDFLSQVEEYVCSGCPPEGGRYAGFSVLTFAGRTLKMNPPFA